MLNRIIHPYRQQRERGRLIRQLAPAQNEQAIQLLAEEDAFNRKLLIITLTGATAVIHISLGTQLFVLNGLGYLVLLSTHLAVPERASYRKYTRSALWGYTGVTVVGYFALRGLTGFADATGMLTKLVELGLMGVLWEESHL